MANKSYIWNKKVLLRERKRHTARRVAIASPCYSGGGGSSTKIFFPSLNMYQAKSGVKKFSLYWGGGPSTKIFFLVWTCIKPNLVAKTFPFTGGGGGVGPLTKNFFSSLNMFQAKSGVKNFSLYWDWVPPSPPRPETRYPPPDLRPGNPLDLDLGPPPYLDLDLGPPHLDLGPPLPGPGTSPPTWTWTWDPPPEQTHTCENITSRRTYVRGR